ncbi:MAG TPA: response regulator, partial [Longimicrobiales bacterium]
ARLESDRPFDLALLDVMMPGATGLEILGAIRTLAHRRALPVVILTARGAEGVRTQALELGAAEFFTKPFSPKRVLARVNELLEV